MQEDSQAQTATFQTSSSRTTRDRVGLTVDGSNAATAVQAIMAAEKAGVAQIWMTQTLSPDILTLFAAAAVQTSRIRMGSSIVPTYPRHPLALAMQALAFNDLAPNRLRLGIGPSHRPTIEGVYGIKMESPLEHLREYVEILRAALWEGKVDHHGRFYNVVATLPRKSEVPILISTLRQGAFQLAGEISDGAISWLCPVPYLLNTALPALRTGADQSGRTAPPVVAHVLAASSSDRQAVLTATRRQIQRYGRLPFYRNMFADAGFPVAADGTMPDELVNSLVISGDDAAIAARFKELLASGLDELLVLHVPTVDAASERTRLMQIMGQL
jgi:F420-dependent oxidoreductase-like protein